MAIFLTQCDQFFLVQRDRVVLQLGLVVVQNYFRDLDAAQLQQIVFDPILELGADRRRVELDDVHRVLTRHADVPLVRVVLDFVADNDGRQGVAAGIAERNQLTDAFVADLQLGHIGFDDTQVRMVLRVLSLNIQYLQSDQRTGRLGDLLDRIGRIIVFRNDRPQIAVGFLANGEFVQRPGFVVKGDNFDIRSGQRIFELAEQHPSRRVL